MELILYSTEGCHLCELAESLYKNMNVQQSLIHRDIAFDDVLFERYGVTIPVLSLQDNSINKAQKQARRVIDELFWPFDLKQLQIWLNKHGIN